MNKQTSLAIMALALAAHASANPVTLGKARAAAARLTPTTDAPALVKAAGVDASQLRKSPLADSAQKPYYIFSRGQGQGYVIVSGDDCLPAILGYTESGDFDEATCAPALADWLAGYEQLITEAQRSGRNAPRKDAARTATAGRRDIAALVQTHWHQSSPYNDQCPTITSNGNRAITGCVATAASQVVFYHKGELPDSIKYDTPTYGYGDAPVTNVFKAGTPLKWDLMQLKYSGGEPSEFREAVATFVAALGAQTWLTYGSSTSGQISNLVYTFGHQFDLSGTCVYKSGYSQSAWEGMLYDDLAAGRPVVYSGVHPTSGGHAVVLDGYQASTGLFHFNFGWGGQSDGWYTVDDQTGMNGFYGQQGMVYKIAPTRQNVEARPVHASTLATGRKNAITVNLTNHSKATYSGVMLFANNTGIEPSSTATATSNDNSTTIAPGATAAVSLTFTPRNEGLWHLFVTDNNRRVLAKDSVEAVAKSAAATLDAIAVDASAATVAGADGHAYPIVYNAKKVAGTLTTANPSDVDYSATVRLSLETSADDGATFRTVGTKAVTLKAAAGTTSQTDFSLTSSTTLPLCTDSLYRLSLQMPSKAANGDELSWATTDTTALFTLREATLEATLEADSTLKFTGDWDAATFTSLAGRRKNAAAKRYDLTEVGHVAAIPSVEGKANALIYVADGSEATGANVVTASGKSRLLDLTAGIDFEPRADIEADSVTLRIGGTPGQWRLLTTPADIALPQGIVARRIDSHSTIGITNKSTYVEQLEAGHTYLLIAASEADTLLTGAHAHVAAQPKANADTIVTGTYKATTLPAKGFILNSESNYFETASEGTAVEAMGGYLLSTGLHTTRFAAYDNLTVDTLYNSLAMLIGQCAEAMESHGAMTTDEANAWMADTLAHARQLYKERSLKTASTLKKQVNGVAEAINTYKRSLLPGLTDIDEDFTSLIANPSFEAGSLKGWTKGGSSAPKAAKTSNASFCGVGSEGDYLLYCATSSADGTDIHQTVEGLLPGTYTLTAMLGTKGDNTVTLHAGALEASTGEHELGQYYLKECRIDGIEVGQDGTLEIGIKPCQWYKADAFKLHCTATAADATGIKSVGASTAAQTSIRAEGGRLIVTTTKPTPVTIHTMQGMAVWRQTVHGTAEAALPKGLYVVGGKKVALTW